MGVGVLQYASCWLVIASVAMRVAYVVLIGGMQRYNRYGVRHTKSTALMFKEVTSGLSEKSCLMKRQWIGKVIMGDNPRDSFQES